jgi:integrase
MSNVLLSSSYFQKWKELHSLRKSTETNYIRQLKYFGDYIESKGWEGELNFDQFYFGEEEGEFAHIDIEFFDEFIEHLHDEIPQYDAKHCFTVVKSFMNLLVDYDLMEYNPLRFVKNPFYYESFRNRSLSEEECIKLLKAALELDPFFKQYYLLILFQTKCGLRASELCKLTVSKINFDMDMILINKGQKTSSGTVRITTKLKELLIDYINHPYFQSWSNGKDKELFFVKNRPFTPAYLNKILNEIRVHTNIPRKVTNHDIRATMAYLLYKNGVNPIEIKKQLRHKKLKTTLLYLPFHVELNGYLD